MNKKQSAKRIYRALEGIDPELLYDARAYRAPQIRPYLRYAVAAIIVLAMIPTALFLKAANTVKTFLTIDTNYGVTLELNAGGRVVRATSAASLYDLPAKACCGLSTQEAAAALTKTMRERGGLSETSNTLLFGVPSGSTDAADALIRTFDAEKACVMTVAVDGDDKSQKLSKKRHITAGKATLLTQLERAGFDIKENRLFRLSMNEIALLMQSRQFSPDGVAVKGKPLDGAFLTKKQIRKIAVEAAGLSPDTVECTLDSDGFKLIYSVLLCEGDKGVAYIIGASSGMIQKEFRGSPKALRASLNKEREEYGAAAENPPPVPASPTQQPASQAPAASEPTAIVPTAQPSTVQQPAAQTKTEPPESPTQAASTANEQPPQKHTYLTASRWAELPDLSSIELIQPQSQASYLLSWMNGDYESHMLRSFEELNQFFDDYPNVSDNSDFCSGDVHSRIEKYHASDFDGRVLITTEYPRGSASEFLCDVYLFRIGDTLYTGVFQRRAQLEGNTVSSSYFRRHMWVDEKDLEGIRQLKMVELTYEDVFGSRLEELYLPVNDVIMRTSEWSKDVTEDTFTIKHKVNIDLRLFNNTLINTYPRDVSIADYEYYDHTAALLTSAEELKNYRSGIDKQIYKLPYPSDTYMQTHAILMTTYVEHYNIPSYYVTAWKKNGVLYVAFTDETSGGGVRKLLDNPYVRVGMIEFEKEQVRDVARIEIVHLKNQYSKTGSGYALADPWD